MTKLSKFMLMQSYQEIDRQTGPEKVRSRSATKKALPPGKRVSRTGKVYWETRRNRSDPSGQI